MPEKKASRRAAGARAGAGKGRGAGAAKGAGKDSGAGSRTGPRTGAGASAVASIEYYRSIFQHSAVPLWQGDISGLRSALAELVAAGITDIRSYLEEHPEFVAGTARGIAVVSVNDAALDLYEAARKEDLLGSLDRTLNMDDPAVLASFSAFLLAVSSGQTHLQTRSSAVTLRGRKLDTLLRFYIPRREDHHPNVLVSVLDFTEQRREHRYSGADDLGCQLRSGDDGQADEVRAARHRGDERPSAEPDATGRVI